MKLLLLIFFLEQPMDMFPTNIYESIHYFTKAMYNKDIYLRLFAKTFEKFYIILPIKSGTKQNFQTHFTQIIYDDIFQISDIFFFYHKTTFFKHLWLYLLIQTV